MSSNFGNFKVRLRLGCIVVRGCGTRSAIIGLGCGRFVRVVGGDFAVILLLILGLCFVFRVRVMVGVGVCVTVAVRCPIFSIISTESVYLASSFSMRLPSLDS